MASLKAKADILDSYLGELVKVNNSLYLQYPKGKQAFIFPSRKLLKLEGLPIYFNDDWSCRFFGNKYELLAQDKNTFVLIKNKPKPKKRRRI